jgi:hypothetical protein
MLGVVFDCKVTHTGSALEVTYVIENRTDADLGVFNRLRALRPDGTTDFSPDIVYADLEADAIHLRKMALPIPKGLQVGAYVPPNASKIGAGDLLKETFTVPIPIRVCHPFKKAMVKGEVVADKLESAGKVVVSIGVFPLGADCRLIQEHPAFPDVLSAFPPHPALSRQVVLSQDFLLDPPLAVLDYRGVDWP